MHGISVLPILFEPPAFGHHLGPGTYPPRNYADIGVFGAAVARRYGPNGTFWAENPLIPRPRSGLPDLERAQPARYWPSGQNAKSYAKLLRRRERASARWTLRQHRHRRASGQQPVEAAERLRLREGAPEGEGGSSFNTLALNPYSKNEKDLLAKLTKFRSILNAGHARGPASGSPSSAGPTAARPACSGRAPAVRRRRSPPSTPRSWRRPRSSGCVASSTTHGATERPIRRCSRTSGASTRASSA